MIFPGFAKVTVVDRPAISSGVVDVVSSEATNALPLSITCGGASVVVVEVLELVVLDDVLELVVELLVLELVVLLDVDELVVEELVLLEVVELDVDELVVLEEVELDVVLVLVELEVVLVDVDVLVEVLLDVLVVDPSYSCAPMSHVAII